MIVILKPDATEEQIQHIVEKAQKRAVFNVAKFTLRPWVFHMNVKCTLLQELSTCCSVGYARCFYVNNPVGNVENF